MHSECWSDGFHSNGGTDLEEEEEESEEVLEGGRRRASIKSGVTMNTQSMRAWSSLPVTRVEEWKRLGTFESVLDD